MVHALSSYINVAKPLSFTARLYVLNMKQVVIIAFVGWMAFCGILAVNASGPLDIYETMKSSICSNRTVNGNFQPYYGKVTYNATLEKFTINLNQDSENKCAEGMTSCFNFTTLITGNLNYTFTSEQTAERINRFITIRISISYGLDAFKLIREDDSPFFVIRCNPSNATFQVETLTKDNMNWVDRFSIKGQFLNAHKKWLLDAVCDENHQYALPKKSVPWYSCVSHSQVKP